MEVQTSRNMKQRRTINGYAWKASFLSLFLFVVISCSEEINPVYTPPPAVENTDLITGAFLEDFEKGTKTSYLSADVVLTSGTWNLSDALIGSTVNDHKFGQKAIRLINKGSARMDFNISTGAGEVHVWHAVYGEDGDNTWTLWMSVDGGVSFEQVGDAVTTNSTTLQKAVFAIKQTGSVRFEIRRESGSAKGLNIDDVEVTSFVVQNPGGSESDNSNYLFGNPSNARNRSR